MRRRDRDGKFLSRSATLPDGIPVSVEIAAGRALGTGYTAEAVWKEGLTDGRAAFGTSTWGPDNHTAWFVPTIIKGAATAQQTVNLQLHHSLYSIEDEIEKSGRLLPVREFKACSALNDVEHTMVARDQLAAKIQSEGLQLPVSGGWKHVAAVLGVPVIVLGFDAALIAPVYQVFGVPDAPIFGPITVLHLAAAGPVMALALLMHLCGRRLSALAHHFSWVVTMRGQAKEKLANRTRVAVSVISGLLLMTGLAATYNMQAGLNGLRAAYFQRLGFGGSVGGFMAIQVAIGVAALMWSAAHSHPYERQWRQADQRAQAAERDGWATVESFVDLNGTHDGLIRQRVHVIAAAIAEAECLQSDAEGQIPIYARALQHGQPEPTNDPLIDEPLPSIEPAAWLSQVAEHLGAIPSEQLSVAAPLFKHYMPYAPLKLIERLGALERRCADHADLRFGEFQALYGAYGKRMQTIAGLNGHPQASS